MSSYTLGIDTSNYATSLAVFNTAGEVVCAKKRFLPVKEGQVYFLYHSEPHYQNQFELVSTFSRLNLVNPKDGL